MRKLLSKVAIIGPKLFFQYCQPAQKQSKSHILFHKNGSLRNFYVMTLPQCVTLCKLVIANWTCKWFLFLMIWIHMSFQVTLLGEPSVTFGTFKCLYIRLFFFMNWSKMQFQCSTFCKSDITNWTVEKLLDFFLTAHNDLSLTLLDCPCGPTIHFSFFYVPK